MTTVGDKVRKAREEKGWSQDELAVAAGVSQTTIDKIERGVTKRSRFLLYIAHKLDIDVRDLDPEMYSAGTQEAASDDIISSENIRASNKNLMPLYSSEAVGSEDPAGGYFIDVPPHPIDFLPRPSFLELVSEAYAVYISDKIMSPEFEEGDIVVFDPRLPYVTDTTCMFMQHGSDLRIIGRLRTNDRDNWHITQWTGPTYVKFSRRSFPRVDRAVAKFYRR